MLPEQIKAQVRWLAENLDDPQAEAAAAALADEVTSLVGNPDGWVPRKAVEHKLEAVKAAGWVFVMASLRLSSTPETEKAYRDWVKAADRRRPPPYVVSIDRGRMTPQDVYAAQDALLDGLNQLGWNISGEDYHDGFTRLVSVTPPRRPVAAVHYGITGDREHEFDPLSRRCRYCNAREDAVALTLARTCPNR